MIRWGPRSGWNNQSQCWHFLNFSSGASVLKCLLMETEIHMVVKKNSISMYTKIPIAVPQTIKWEKNYSVIALSWPQADLLSYVCQTEILTRSNLKRCLATFTCIAQKLSVSSETYFLHALNKIFCNRLTCPTRTTMYSSVDALAAHSYSFFFCLWWKMLIG